MKTFGLKNSLLWRLSVALLILFAFLGAAYVFITTRAAQRYFEESTQKLNAHVAEHMLAEVKPFVNGEPNEEALGSLMHSMMAVNPGLEVYLLDAEGKILTYVVLEKNVKLKRVSLEPVTRFIAEKGRNYVLGDDPRQAGKQTIFSAAEIRDNGKLLGYAYLVLASEVYENVAGTLLGSYWLRVGTNSFVITLLAAFFLGLLLIVYLTRHLREIVKTVSRFEAGDLKARIPENKNHGELAHLSRTFNHMADTILHNIEELKNTDNLRRDLIASVSHDLRSPLAVIHGYVETLMMKAEQLNPEEKTKYLEIVLQSSEKLKRLVSDLFELSKLEVGHIKPKKEAFLVNELLFDASRKFRILAEQKNIILKYNIEEAMPRVYADISMIERVIQNLIENAVKYTPAEGWVSLDATRTNGSIRVKVLNSGEGIPPGDLSSVFDRYYMVNRAKSADDGSGLGLAIVKKIMDVHNARVEVESIPGNYTSFCFDLPVVN